MSDVFPFPMILCFQLCSEIEIDHACFAGLSKGDNFFGPKLFHSKFGEWIESVNLSPYLSVFTSRLSEPKNAVWLFYLWLTLTTEGRNSPAQSSHGPSLSWNKGEVKTWMYERSLSRGKFIWPLLHKSEPRTHKHTHSARSLSQSTTCTFGPTSAYSTSRLMAAMGISCSSVRPSLRPFRGGLLHAHG